MENYVFPAIFTKEPLGISIEFPDLPGCLSCADNYRQAFKSAKEALHLHLLGMIQDEEDIPEPTDMEDISPPAGSVLMLIETQI